MKMFVIWISLSRCKWCLASFNRLCRVVCGQFLSKRLTKKVVRPGAFGSTAISASTFVLSSSRAVNFHLEPKLVALTQPRQGRTKSEVFAREVNSYVTAECDPFAFSSAFIFYIGRVVLERHTSVVLFNNREEHIMNIVHELTLSITYSLSAIPLNTGKE